MYKLYIKMCKFIHIFIFYIERRTLMNTFNFVRCPYCGYEYVAGEIFNPKHFLGQPKDIVRNNIGEILGYEGLIMDTTETYICDSCEQEFNVTAKITFTYTTNNNDKNNEPEIKKASLF